MNAVPTLEEVLASLASYKQMQESNLATVNKLLLERDEARVECGMAHEFGKRLMVQRDALEKENSTQAVMLTAYQSKTVALTSALRPIVFFLDDYLRSTRHPGVSRLVADAREALNHK